MKTPNINSVSIHRENKSYGHLLPMWVVDVYHDAWCGHESCGTELSTFYFIYGKDALEFLNSDISNGSWVKHV